MLTPRSFSRFALSFALSSSVGVPALLADSSAGAKPNIIFVLVDDMGWGDLNCNWEHGAKFKNRNRSEQLKTPQLDKMAKEGVLLARHYTACPVSAPARASLMTGVHQGHTRQVRDNTFDTPIADVHTLGSVLREAGYATAAIGKWGIGGVGNGSNADTGFGRARARGFDYFYGIFDHMGGHYHYPANTGRFVWENETDVTAKLKSGNAYSTDLFAARAKDWLVAQKKANPSKPVFLYLAFPAPHGSLRVPNCAYPSGGGLRGGVQWAGDTVNTADASLGAPDSYIHPECKAFSTDAARRHSTMIRRVDDAMGDLFTLLKDLKMDENTLVVFTSDNGPHAEPGNDSRATAYFKSGSPRQDPAYFQSYGMMDGIKRDCLEGGLRVPAIVRWPAHINPKKKDKINTTPSQFHDWMATFADAAGVEVPSRSDGVSLLPTLTGEGNRIPGQIYCEYSVGGGAEMFKDFDDGKKGRSRRNQLVVWVDGYKGIARNLNENSAFSGDGAVQFEIYDTLKDPQETKNLAKKLGEKMQQKFRDKALRSRRAFDGKHPHEYTRGLDFSQKTFFERNPVPAIGETCSDGTLALNYKAFASKTAFPWVPDFRQTHLRSVIDGKCTVGKGENLLPAAFVSGRGARGILLEGEIGIEREGEYVFSVKTDSAEGSKAFVHLYDIQLVDADKLYKPGTTATSHMNVGTEKATGTKGVFLEKGTHKIRIEYVCAGTATAPSLVLDWTEKQKSLSE